MLKKLQKTLSVGLSGLLALSIGVANASNVLHEMVPHVVLPDTIQYAKTAKHTPGTGGYVGAKSPYVASYVAYPSYQVPHTTAFRSVGQAVYPVTPLLPAPLPNEQTEPEDTAEVFVQRETGGEDIVLSPRVAEPIRLASGSIEGPPALPKPNGTITQTQGLFCQKPASPPAAWAFSSPLFKVASVPAGWGGQVGGIVHSGPRGSQQLAGFQPAGGVDSDATGAAPQGTPYSTFQMGQPMGQNMGQNVGPQVQVLPNGMVLVTMPPDHANCGLIRCKSGHTPRNILLPPAGFCPSQTPQGMMPPGMMPPQMAMMSGGYNVPFMQVSQQPMMPQMMPQMQTIPVTAMSSMGPAIVGYQQAPMMNPMAMIDPQMQQMQMAVAMQNPAVASQVPEVTETGEGGEPPMETSPAMAVVATPFGYAIQVPADALQGDAATQLAQMQQSLAQSQMTMQTNPYAGLYATPFGYIAMSPTAGQFGYGQPMMMPVGNPMGMVPMGMSMQGGGMSVSDMLQIMAFLNNNKPKQRTRLADRIAERRETRKDAAQNDLFAQLMQAWSTPFVAPDTTLRMPSRNAYPYGYFGVQASPVGTANYGGYHNLYFGNTTYPGLY